MEENRSLIELNFPFDQLSTIAKHESWRKEIHRPLSYIHKWWARRLGSVFRGLMIGGLEAPEASLFNRYYSDVQYCDKIIFDPFMGSGTTITEAVKLGAKVVGSDINPVAATMVRAALDEYEPEAVINTFKEIERKCSKQIKSYYKAIFADRQVDVLYYFWVKTITCEACKTEIPLYKSSVFSKNAYPSRKPEAQSICPFCNEINEIKYSDKETTCRHCGKTYNPQKGNVERADYVCPVCGNRERIVDYVRRTKAVLPQHMYAKIIIDDAGKKHYSRIDDYDLELYAQAEKDLTQYLSFIPNDPIHAGINTNQILNYQYKQWREMFNSRQLLSFAILTKAIGEIEDISIRRLFAVLMSGTLEFNNMFCTFKGEGTGAVRPLFHNHILKNEPMPLEANVWGVKASSGGFSAFFKTRILRAIEYKENPFEIRIGDNGRADKHYLRNCKIEANTTANLGEWDVRRPLILCKDSSNIGLPSKSVDLVLTDPPFFDNVNYSELADFFFVWLKKLNIGIDKATEVSTRVSGEVQDDDPIMFEKKLCDVFRESNRVLKDTGALIFTYHHSRVDGWVSVYNAIHGSGFRITQVIPIKAEMSVSVSIQAAKTPINYNLVFVCRKTGFNTLNETFSIEEVITDINGVLLKMSERELNFSKGDKTVLLYGHALKYLSSKGIRNVTTDDIEEVIANLLSNNTLSKHI
jgi:putative DNA methylase